MSATPTTTEATSLLGALAAFQAEVPTLPKDATNPHFRSKFTPLDTIVERTKPLLAKHGLTWAAFPTVLADGKPGLRYVLGHVESDETMEDTMPLLAQKNDPQGQGSAITYARRYAMCAVLNLVADEDDDGNAGSAPAAAQPETTVAKDADRPAAPPIPLDRAASIAEQAVAAGLAEKGADGAFSFSPVLKAQLQLIGVQKIGALNVDQAEAVEAFIAQEREGQS